MGYKALVTLDLKNAPSDQRKTFYEILEEENWSKIPNLDTAWKLSFDDIATRIGAIATIKNDLKKAKDKSKLQRVDYALQLDKSDLIIENLL